jgi:hypothetical protein
MGRSSGEDQIVVDKIDLAGEHAVRVHVDPRDARHDHPDVLVLPHDGADRPGDVSGRQRRGCYFIKQRLKAMVVVGVDERYVDINLGERPARFESGETGTDDHHLRPLRFAVHSSLRSEKYQDSRRPPTGSALHLPTPSY